MKMQKWNRPIVPAAVLAVLCSLAGCGVRPKSAASAQLETAGSGITVRTEQGAYNEACPALFELSGPVENCVVENWQTGTAEGEFEQPDLMWGRNYGFNRRGYLEFDGCNEYTYRADTLFLYGEDARAGMSATLTYDDAGRIVAQKLEYEEEQVGDGERSTEFTYDAAGRLTRTYTVLWETGVETLYTYDPQGRLATRRETAYDYDGFTERIHTYEYVAFDEYGNWTQRKVTVKTTEVQAVEGAEHEESEVVQEPDVYQFETRRITYYE